MVLINDYPFKYVGDMLVSYILPLPFDSKIEGNYLMNTLWPYWKGLLETPNTLGYVGTNPHG
jgi:hypothetical protein